MDFGDRRLPLRFWEKTSQDQSGCWLWTASLNHGGYGQFSVKYKGKWRPRVAHRVAYEELVGEIAESLDCDHLCRVRRCVNPAHIEVVTNRENTRRGIIGLINSKRAAERTHCKNGHPFAGENLRVGLKQRFCIQCRRTASREFYLRKRASDRV